jgi:cyclic pyranopterin phosphate synthase
MKDVSGKEKSLRTSTAEGFIYMSSQSIEKIRNNEVPKGDVLEISRISGIMAAKQTPALIPMCHNISLAYCNLRFELKENHIQVISEAKAIDRTGVEMEALTAVSAALLNIYDMVKPIDESMEIRDIRLLSKTGGKSGDYSR